MRSVVGRLIMTGFGVFFLMSAAHADIFHCVDRDGRYVFRDTPCPKGMRTSSVTAYLPAAQPEPEREQPVTDEVAALRRIAELEREVAELRASLQAAQAAPAPAPEVVQEPVYAPSPAVIVLANRPHHDGDGHHHEGHGQPQQDGSHSVRRTP